jgi:hypothetical protein
MKFKELESKKSFNNKYGNNSYISSYCYYEGTEQISIYIKTGYGASEKLTNEVISEHDLDEWIEEFTNGLEVHRKEVNKKVVINNNKTILSDKMIQEEIKKEEIMVEKEVVKEVEKKDDFDSMRRLLFESMRMVKQGELDVEKAKSISSMAQTIINSVKVEIDFLKLTGSDDKPKMIS